MGENERISKEREQQKNWMKRTSAQSENNEERNRIRFYWFSSAKFVMFSL